MYFLKITGEGKLVQEGNLLQAEILKITGFFCLFMHYLTALSNTRFEMDLYYVKRKKQHENFPPATEI